MIARWQILAGTFAVAVMLATGVALYIDNLRGKVDDLTAENESLTRSALALKQQADRNAEAREVEAARAERWAKRSAELDASIEALLTGDIPDAPLDPRIIAILDAGGVLDND